MTIDQVLHDEHRPHTSCKERKNIYIFGCINNTIQSLFSRSCAVEEYVLQYWQDSIFLLIFRQYLTGAQRKTPI